MKLKPAYAMWRIMNKTRVSCRRMAEGGVVVVQGGTASQAAQLDLHSRLTCF